MKVSIVIEYDTDEGMLEVAVEPKDAAGNRMLLYGVLGLAKEAIMRRALGLMKRPSRVQVAPADALDSIRGGGP